MPDREPNRPATQDDDDDEESGLDLAFVLDYLSYVLRAVRLHKKRVFGIFVTIVVVAFFVVRALPRTYHVESKLLAQRESILGQGNPYGSDPLKGASDIVMAHDYQAALIKQLDLLTWWRQHLVWIQRAKASVFALISRPPTEEEQMRTLIEILSTKMTAATGDGTVTFTLDWPDAEMAARIVDTAEQNFLEKRHVLEISTIAEQVSILEGHAAKLREEIADLTQSAKAAGDAPPAKAPGGPAAGASPAPQPAATAARAAAGRRPVRRPENDAEFARQKVMIETKQRVITDLEDFRQRRLLELQQNLVEQRSKYTDEHPVIVGIQQNIASISRESPQVATLRAEVKALQDSNERALREAELADARAPTGGGSSTTTPSAAVLDAPGLLLAPGEERDRAVDAQIGNTISKYTEIGAQISTARIDLDLAQAAFRYRYNVVQPAQPPLAPIKPKAAVIMAGATLAALLLGIISAVVAELRVDRLVNRWQVERNLKLPVLAELRLPQHHDTREDRS